MTEKIAIRVSHLGKRYQLGGPKEPYHTFRDAIVNSLKAPMNIFHKAPPDESFWALKDVSFEVEQGEVVGIIGRNGAGKSTLLKILSRITPPTEGTIELHGRVGSLLEVGTGFHPEMTGRENIFLNGSILGMKKIEIEQKFDEIVKFSEIEKFIDTPVKRFSSGMYVRLAFAVAAHLEPEILVVDEVLAVGDAAFQKKCLGKMGEVAKQGRTVLFVSHQMGSIAQLCRSAILLENGQISQRGPVSEVIAGYMNLVTSNSTGFKPSIMGKKDISIIKAGPFDENGNPMNIFSHLQPITIEITCKINKWVRGAEIRMFVRDSRRTVFTTDTEIILDENRNSDTFIARSIIPGNLLRPGIYFFTLWIYVQNIVVVDEVVDAISITVIDGGSKYSSTEGLEYGCVFVDCSWSIEPV